MGGHPVRTSRRSVSYDQPKASDVKLSSRCISHSASWVWPPQTLDVGVALPVCPTTVPPWISISGDRHVRTLR